MTQPIINPNLRRQLESIIASAPHAVLLVGSNGAGKDTLLSWVSENIAISKKGSKEFLITMLTDKKSIGIDQIKQLKAIFKTKDSSYRIIRISQAEKMTIEAQNSLLKLLEEPPTNVIFLLSCTKESDVLETIRSRMIVLHYAPPETEQLAEYIASHGHSSEKDRFIKICGGRMGVLSALCGETDDQEVLHNIDVAKDILSETVEDRLLRVESLTKDSEKALELLDALLLTCSAALEHAIQTDAQYHRWLHRQEVVELAYSQIYRNILPKLVLTRLFLVL